MSRILKGFFKLARLDRPIGIWLIFWPALATLLATTQGQDFAKNLFIIIIGSIVVRSLGCVINDVFDRNIDSKVARTKNRPIAAGQISVFEALTFFVFLLLIAILLLIHTNFHTLLISLCFGLLIIIYPLMKRIFWGPQIFLGLVFNPALIVSAMNNNLSKLSLLLYTAFFFWVVAYDTYYGLADINDDKKIGVNSTAIALGHWSKLGVIILQTIFLLLLVAYGNLMGFTNIWFVGLLGIIIFFLYQALLAQKNLFIKAFKNNGLVGAFICLLLFFEFIINV